MWAEADIGGTMDIGAVRPIPQRIGWHPITMESDFLKAIGTVSAADATMTIIGITTVTATSIVITIVGSLFAREV